MPVLSKPAMVFVGVKALGKASAIRIGMLCIVITFPALEGFLIHLSAAALKMSLKAHTQSYLVVAVHDYSVVGTRGEQYHFLCSN